jgi:CheY-like chemotaxis protein
MGPACRRPLLNADNATKAPLMRHVLIIEDDIVVAMDLEAVLQGAGATSFAFASTEAEAVEQACARRPLIITSDVRLSAGTGPAAVRIIRARLGMIPALFVCATPADCTPTEPGDLIFGKPFDRLGLASAFRGLLGGREGRHHLQPGIS